MISAVFRRGGDVSFVAEELKAIFDPQGGRWIDGRYVPSLLAAIGEVIESHMVRTGLLPADERERARALAVAGKPGGTADAGSPATLETRERTCPQCGVFGLRRLEGCWICPTCAYSQCG